MEKYGGTLIHKSRDLFGDIEVVDHEETRSLYFGSHIKQSSMWLDRPNVLALRYTEGMMASLLIQPNPKRILLLGLGAGSLAKFYYHHFPKCQITIVECSDKVVKVAHGYFHLPEDDRIQIVHQDAALYLYSIGQRLSETFDHICVDLFSADGPATVLYAPKFFAICRSMLTERGVLTSNLWATDKVLFDGLAKEILQQFSNNALFFTMKDYGNVIGMGLVGSLNPAQKKKLSGLSKALSLAYGFDFSDFVKEMQNNNKDWFKASNDV